MAAEDYWKRFENGAFDRAYRIGELNEDGFVLIYEGKVQPRGHQPIANVVVFKQVAKPGNLGGAQNFLTGDTLNRSPDIQEMNGVGVLPELKRKGLSPLQPGDWVNNKGGYQGKLPSWTLDMVNSYRVSG